MGQTKFTDSTDVLPTFKSITDIHVESPEGVVCVVGEIKSMSESRRRDNFGEGQLGVHMALTLAMKKVKQVLGFLATPNEIKLYYGYSDGECATISSAGSFGDLSREHIIHFLHVVKWFVYGDHSRERELPETNMQLATADMN
jgi:hypothetical protein